MNEEPTYEELLARLENEEPGDANPERRRRHWTRGMKALMALCLAGIIVAGVVAAAVILSAPVKQTQTLTAVPLVLTVSNMTATQGNGTNTFTVKAVNGASTSYLGVFIVATATCTGSPTVAINDTTTNANICAIGAVFNSQKKSVSPSPGATVWTFVATYTIPAPGGSMMWTFQAEQ